MVNKKILVTGAAGFIGFHLCCSLVKKGYSVVGLDNLNDYYDINLKLSRLNQLGILEKDIRNKQNLVSSSVYGDLFQFIKTSLENQESIFKLFDKQRFSIVCNLAAQAGVRYSLKKPHAYVESNVSGFLSVLEASRKFKVDHLIYASTSSVYGTNTQIPFAVDDITDSPVSIYAATKKTNELMAHVYSHNFKLRTTGLRFFTVYGPWGRPDMAMFLFTDAILNNKPIQVYNNGNMERDFTFIDDVIEGIIKIIEQKTNKNIKNDNQYRLYNIGNNNAIRLLDFINVLESKLGIVAEKKFLPMQTGDIKKTWANVNDLIEDYNYQPNTSIEKGVSDFVDWYKAYHKI